MAAEGPRPGSAPTNSPNTHPTVAMRRLIGDTATLNPSSRLLNVSSIWSSPAYGIRGPPGRATFKKVTNSR